MKILTIINYILIIISTIYASYFSIMGIIGLILKNKAKFKESKQKINFAILIPARNEECVIKNLVTSLKKQNYPEDKYTIYTVVNNCTDNTREVAKNAGSKIIECTKPTKTKADVLNIAFEELRNEKIDAYIVFDADNVVHPEFLNKMNNCYNSGYEVAEGFRDAKNPYDNWISGGYTLFYLTQNIFFNKSRMSLNASAALNGTGFMVSKKIIDEKGFLTFSLTEDVEFTGQCALNRTKIAFVEDAITYDEYPTNFKVSWRQRKRWSCGNNECVRRYSWKLLKSFIKSPYLPCLDMGLSYMGAYFQLVTFVTGILTLIILIVKYSLIGLIEIILSKVLLTVTIVTYLFSIILFIIMLAYKKKNILKMLIGIIMFPVFIFSWIPINIAAVVKKEVKWLEIKHNVNVDYEKIVK